MKICYKSVTKIELDKLPSNPDGSLNVASLPPESSVLHVEFEPDGSLMHIIYSMEDEPLKAPAVSGEYPWKLEGSEDKLKDES